MKKLLFFTLALVVACTAAMAAPVDVMSAKIKALQCIQKEIAGGRLMSVGNSNPTLIKTEMGENSKAPVFYIFNTEQTFVIVSGDDRAEEILAVGDEPLDINNIPENMQMWLDGYAEQIDWLNGNPDAKVEKTSDLLKKDAHLNAISDVSPMLTCNWDQSAPYYNQCKFTYNGRTYQCVTGCPATSAAQVMYYWKWPITQVGPLDSYTNYLNDTYTYTYPALEATTFDWGNMKDTYRSYTTAQANAVATLMRYVGQKEEMMYGTDGSGIYTTQSNKIVNMYKAFGYNQNTVRLVNKSSYNETNWANLLQAELAEGRPVVYLGTSNSAGHAFNVDGYRASDNTYHVNFGWSGSGNGYCAMNAFSSQSVAGGSTYTFNQNQQMVIGIQPTDDYFDPTIVANPTSVTFSDCYATRTYTQTINVRGINLSGNLTISKSGSNVISVSPTTITPEDASAGVDVTITYAPTAAGNANATLTLASSGATSKTVTITGSAQAATPTVITNTNALTYSTAANTPEVRKIGITGRFLTGNVTLTLNDANGVFNLGTTTIPAANISEATPVEVVVSFESANEGTFNGTVTIASSGAQTQTVQLTATVDNSGSASDTYLDVAKYATIDQAGWTASYVNNFYKYTEKPDEGIAWLTLPVYGAWTGYRYQSNAGPQKWIESDISTTTTSGINGAETWSATDDIWLGSSVYFTSTTAKYFGNSSNNARTWRTITFRVTNTTAVELFGKNYSSSNLNATTASQIVIYEGTKNANGTVTYSSTATQTITGGTGNQSNVKLEATGLDPNKVYKVVLRTFRTKLYEVAFQTKLPTITTSPTAPYIVVGPNETGTETLTIKGDKITDDVQITLNDPEGLFSISKNSVDVIDALAGTATVDVTFNGPEEYGEHTATMTLTSGDITKTVNLYGAVVDKGTAHSDYLDIKRYATIDENDWCTTEEIGDHPYEYTLDEENDCAWLTIPTYMVYGGLAYDDQMWAGGNWSNMNLYSFDWTPTDIFYGSANYFGSYESAVLGSSGITATGSTTFAYMYFCVTNCTKAKALMYNIDPDTDYPTFMQVFDITETDEFGQDNLVDAVEDNTQGDFVVLESSVTLEPSRIYAIVIGGERTAMVEMGFRTPVEGAPKTPINVEADPGSTTAEITWTPGENNTGWNLRWRPWVDMLAQNRFWDFEDATQYSDFTFVDNDGDGHNWGRYSGEGLTLQSGSYAMLSEGYDFDNNAWLTPDNWMISPKVKLGGSISFYAAVQYADYGKGPVAVYVYQGDSWTSVSQFTQVGSDTQVTGTMTKYTFNLSNYSGPGYVAIVHHNSNQTPYLNIDDIEILVPDAQEGLEEYEWNYCNDVTSPYIIEGLDPETTYEVQVQGVNEAGVVGNWTESTIFTTLPITSKTLAQIEGTGVKGETYIIGDELVAVYADIDNGMLWCKDQGNASINPSSIIDGQIDFMNDANLTGTTGQNGRDWDQSNWVALKFIEATADNGIESLLNSAVGKKIKAGTVTGAYIDNNNYTIEVQPVNDQYTLTLNGSSEYTPNVYCAANFNESNLNIGGNTGAVGPHGDHYFFMNPKIQEICEITYAMWDGEMFVTPDNTSIQGAFHVDWSRNSTDGMPTLQEGQTYRFIAIVSRPAKLADLRGGGTPSDNFVVYPANLSGDSNIVTAINGVYIDGNREVVGVEYVNAAGIVSKTPFHGVNIVVTRYSDGSKTTTKKVFK